MAFAVSGATTVSASDTHSLSGVSGTADDTYRMNAPYLVTGLSVGSNTFTAIHSREYHRERIGAHLDLVNLTFGREVLPTSL